MKTTLSFLLLLLFLIYISPFFSLYKIGVSIQNQDKQTLNIYMDWNDLQKSLKSDVKLFLKNREKLREKDLDNPVEGILEDVKKFGGLLFGDKAISIAVKKVVTPEGIFKLYELVNKSSNSNNNPTLKKKADSELSKTYVFTAKGYTLISYNFISLSDIEANVETSNADIYFKMRFIFPRWILYTVKSEKLTDEIARKVEDKIDLLKNLSRKINPLK
jgi:hypothetical protein